MFGLELIKLYVSIAIYAEHIAMFSSMACIEWPVKPGKCNIFQAFEGKSPTNNMQHALVE